MNSQKQNEKSVSLRRLALGLAGVAMLGLSTAAQANSVSYSGSIPASSPNWSSSVSIPQFSGGLGTLDSISFSLTGTATGTAMFESTDPVNGSQITTKLTTTITLMRPDTTLLVQVIPLQTLVDNMPAFDGVLDFGGTSGKTYGSLSASQSDSLTLGSISPGDAALFIGGGNISLPVTANGVGGISANGGSWLGGTTTKGAANVTVTYNYTPAPVPDAGSSWVLLMTGLACLPLGFLRRKS